MAKYRVAIDLCASTTLYMEADSPEEAGKKARAEIYDEDEFIEIHKSEIFIWDPVIDEIVEEEE